MATTNKAAKESAPKAVKATSAEPAAEKTDSVKSKKKVATPEDLASTDATSPTETDSTVTPQPPTVASDADFRQTAAQTMTSVVTDERWQEIKQILEKLKEETLREIRKSVKNGTEAVAAIEPGGDIYDQASSERDRELGLLLGDREREKIHSIDEALLRIDEGDYGICEECDEDIPLGRLKAMPFTRHCVKCKADLEKLQAQTKRVEEERAYREIPLGAEDEES